MAKKKKSSLSIIILIIIVAIGIDQFLFDGKYRKQILPKSVEKEVEKQIKDIKTPEKKDTDHPISDKPIVVEEVKGDFYQIYFSQTYNNNPKAAKANPNSIDRKLASVIRKAKKQIYAAIHELDSEVITDAILDAHKNGVEVKILTEDSYIEEESIIRLQKAGIPVVDDSSVKSSRLMHNKFFVIDREWVWTGSLNPTDNGCYKNNNNAVLIRSQKLAQNFLDEFNEMFDEKSFGKQSPKKIQNPKVQFPDSTIVKTLFAPENNVANALVKEIEKAKKSIYFYAFSFTHDKMGKAMIKRYRDGVKVMGIFEKRGHSTKYSEFNNLKKAGIKTIVTDTNKYVMHHKVIVIDDKITITGSFNFSKNADKKNDENVLIIDNPKIAKAYVDEFKRLYSGPAQ